MQKKTYQIKVEYITTGSLWWKKSQKYFCIYEVTSTPVYQLMPFEEIIVDGLVDYQKPSYKLSYKLIEKHVHEQHAQVSLESWLKYNSE